jgi:hypothetical protein
MTTKGKLVTFVFLASLLPRQRRLTVGEDIRKTHCPKDVGNGDALARDSGDWAPVNLNWEAIHCVDERVSQSAVTRRNGHPYIN